MFTDIVGYSKMTQSNEQLAMKLMREHNELLRPIFFKYNGHEIKTIGDAFLLEFPNVLDATHCAIECQNTLFERNKDLPVEQQVRIRIGIHVGDVIFENNDIFGDGVNIAARIQPLADPGGICVSEDVARQIQNKIDIPVISLGQGELKNIKLAVMIYKVLLPWEKNVIVKPRMKSYLQNKQIVGLSLFIIAVFAVIGLLSKYDYIKFSHKGLKAPDDLAFTDVEIPMDRVITPSISGDGNWITFTAVPQSGYQELYVIISVALSKNKVLLNH
jgi:class 3 adenylate cyclase